MNRQTEFTEIMKRGAQQFGIALNDIQLEQFELYMHEMIKWNEIMNLTTITEEKDIAVKHFIDSISLCSVIKHWDIRVLDIGTGAGFPGIPLRIVNENIQLTLMDSIRKKTDFLLHLSSILDIQYNVLCMRAEDGAKDSLLRESFDLVVSRAVAKMPVLAEYCLPFVSVGGYFVAMKSESAEDEVHESQNAVHILGGSEAVIHRIELQEYNIARSLVVVKKIEHTPEKYPRRAGQPEKRPLL